MSPEQIADMFLQQFYQNYQTQRQNLANFYDANVSTFTGEAGTVKGRAAIMEKLLSFPQCQVQINSKSAQVGPTNNSILIMVNGNIQLAGQENHLKFSQAFVLVSLQGGNMYIHNDIFQLNYAS